MSLNSLLELAAEGNLKFVFVGGKGGVGKTTTSSALASLLARHHKRVLLISTDPAHSLGDAWRQSFSGYPTRVPLHDNNSKGSLEVMEINPKDSLQGELAGWAQVSQELFHSGSSNDDKSDEWMSRIHQFQEWLSGIPGIDEATALSTAISHIESGKYDLIVFDTAPTGHTLKLLALPDILEQGIEKLQSWQTTFWGYWQALKAASGGGLSQAQKRASLKQEVTEKLERYKAGIQKVACMLQDQQRTRFVAVCVAEYLSIAETQRLLQELAQHKVVASHIVVNQLVVQDALSTDQLQELEALAEVGTLQLPQDLLLKTVHACRLTTARKSIQQRYLQELKSFPETQLILNGICEVPLLAEEVTGAEAIQRFSELLATDVSVPISSEPASIQANQGGALYDDAIAAKNKRTAASASNESFAVGDAVRLVGLSKSPQFNGLEGKVTSSLSNETGRQGVSLTYKGKTKTLALQPKNMEKLVGTHDDKKRKGNTSSAEQPQPSTEQPLLSEGIMDKAKAVLEDAEIKQLIEKNPRFKTAVQDCVANPMNVMKYLGDPEMSPLISKALSKM